MNKSEQFRVPLHCSQHRPNLFPRLSNQSSIED